MVEKRTTFDYINIILMLVIFAVTLYPVIYVISISFSSSSYIVLNQVTFFPKGFTLEAYKMIAKNQLVPRAYLNTIIYTSVGTFVNLFMTAMAAYPLSKKNFFGRKVYMKLIVFTMFFTGGIIPNYIIVQQLGLIDSMWALILPNAIWTFELLILKSFYESIEASLYESAVIDGASEYRILFQIIIPLSKAALASIGLFYFMGHWNSFFIPMIYLNSIKKFPLQVVLRDMLIDDTAMQTYTDEMKSLTPQGMKNATIFVSMVPVLIVYPFAQKYFVKGVMVGSVKG